MQYSDYEQKENRQTDVATCLAIPESFSELNNQFFFIILPMYLFKKGIILSL